MVHMQINNMLDTRLFQASCLSPFGPHFVRSNMLQAYLSAGMTSSLFSIFMYICSSKSCEYSNNSVNYILEIIMWDRRGSDPFFFLVDPVQCFSSGVRFGRCAFLFAGFPFGRDQAQQVEANVDLDGLEHLRRDLRELFVGQAPAD
jgi:hypothetical protein